MSDIPQWAVERALKRCRVSVEQSSFIEWRDRTYALAVENLAQMIAAHEEPPVDPLAEALGEALDEIGLLDPAWAGAPAEKHKFASVLRSKLAKRGVEIGDQS